MVAFHHFPSTASIVNTSFIRSGWMFVDFFFVLSGFVIALSYLGRLESGYSIGRFMLLRLGRIYPLHIFMLGVFLLFQLALMSGQGGQADPAANREMGQFFGSAMLINIFGIWQSLGWNVPSWSISAEIWAYLLFALAVRFGGRFLPHILLTTIAVSVLVLALEGDRYLDRTFSFSLVRCCYGFSLGVIAFRVDRHLRGRIPVLGYGVATILEIAAIIACVLVLSFVSKPMTLLVPLLFFVITLVFARQAGGVSRILMLAPFLLLGTLSYSIYMTHVFVEGRIRNAVQVLEKVLHMNFFRPVTMEGETFQMIELPGIWNELMVFAILIPIVAIAYLTWRFIEEPGRRLSRNWVDRDKGRGGMTGPPSAVQV
jgi:peptidoglycan/LPS O-acetylase OafA/YrhL